MRKFSGNGHRTPALLSPKPARRLAIAFFILFACQARASEFSVPFKPLKRDMLVTEIAWQAANAVDLQQTLRGSRLGFRETGTLEPFCGSHPGTRQVWIGMAAFAVAHYAVTQGLANLGWTTAARVWSYGSLALKIDNDRRNAGEGLGL